MSCAWRIATGASDAGTVVWLGLGSNEGDRGANLASALDSLTDLVSIDGTSPVYETDPVGYADQPAFWNLVVRGRTDLPAEALLAGAKRIEVELGRRADTVRWGPRPIDIDILLYGTLRVAREGLVIPHPRLLERGFVVRPMADIDEDVRHPVTGERIGAVAERLGPAGLRLLFPAESLREE